jgi:hypothetical protein
MGLGGYLTWTSAARAIKKHLDSKIKILPIESHGSLIKTIKNEIFHNNPDFYQEWKNDIYTLPFVLNNPNTNYCKKDTPEKALHRYDKHIIEQICENFGINNPELKCNIHLTKSEIDNIDILCNDLPENFVTINTDVNSEYTKNKFNIFSLWQKVVDNLKDEIDFVQVGIGNKILDNSIDLTGKTTFREASGIIGRSSCFVGSEGGLVHAATSFDIPGVVIMTSFLHPDLVKYPGNINFWLNNDGHGPCGMKIYCKKCHDNMKYFNIEKVCKAIKGLIGGNK